jgi:hypothetical protein
MSPEGQGLKSSVPRDVDHGAHDWVSCVEVPPDGHRHGAAECTSPIVDNAPRGADAMSYHAEAFLRPALGGGGRHFDDCPATVGPGEGDFGDGRVKAASAAMAPRMVDVTDDEARHVRALLRTPSAPSRKRSENHSSNKSAAFQHAGHATPSTRLRIRTSLQMCRPAEVGSRRWRAVPLTTPRLEPLRRPVRRALRAPA